MSREIVIFNTDSELVDLLKAVKNRGERMFTIDCTINKTRYVHTTGKRIATVKSRIDGTKFEDLFETDVFCTETLFVKAFVPYYKAIEKAMEKKGIAPKDIKEEGLRGDQVWIIKDLISYSKKFDCYYLRYALKRNANFKYSEYINHLETGELLSDELNSRFRIEFAPKEQRTYSAKQGEAGLTDIEDQIEVRGTFLSGVRRLVLDGKVYIRNGFESKEEKQAISDWHEEMAETAEF